MPLARIQMDDTSQDFALNFKEFRKKSRGYHGTGKMTSGGKRYQVNILLVEIGSGSNPQPPVEVPTVAVSVAPTT